MKIQIAGLSEGVHDFHFREPVADVGLGEEFRGDVDVSVILERTGRQLFMKAEVSATGWFTCDRCTELFSMPLRAKYRMYYVWDEGDADLYDPSEVQVIPAGLPLIDLADDVRQTVMLTVPLKLLCKDECKGLCPHCGTDLNKGTCTCASGATDPRFEVLRGFRAKSN
jgi:uncharacterized protein